MQLLTQPFLLFGMGHRRKLLYKSGVLSDARSGEVLRRWDILCDEVAAPVYSVWLQTRNGQRFVIEENESGIWLLDNDDNRTLIEGNGDESRVVLPRFKNHPHAALSRTLHAEILVNVTSAGPLPNFLVYSRPWYRDAAMVALCLQRTGNLHLLEEWIVGLREPFDLNNAGQREPDNLGQVLFLISLVSDASHPLVKTVLELVPEFIQGNHLTGPTDFSEHPVYQTKWLKYGLRSLGLNDPYKIPAVFDSYSSLFWMDFKDEHVPGPAFPPDANELYPYLAWAEAHFHAAPPPLYLLGDNFPLTWEAQASQADYQGMRPISPQYSERKICAPHTWHAAEAFLYLIEAS